MNTLENFIITAKATCYVGDGAPSPSSRPTSHDLGFQDGDWRYLDSYFGGTDFIGQEVVWHKDKPVWAMNYYGYILQAAEIDAEKAGEIIKTALSALYAKNRFLGGFEYLVGDYTYNDGNTGDVTRFHGIETISHNDIEVYRLDYHGGMIKP